MVLLIFWSCKNTREEPFFEDGTLESFVKFGARIQGTSISYGAHEVFGIPDNDTEGSSFEYPSEIETAAHHTIQLFGGDIDVDTGTKVALPPRIKIFTFGTPTSSVSPHIPANFSAGGRGFAVLDKVRNCPRGSKTQEQVVDNRRPSDRQS